MQKWVKGVGIAGVALWGLASYMMHAQHAQDVEVKVLAAKHDRGAAELDASLEHDPAKKAMYEKRAAEAGQAIVAAQLDLKVQEKKKYGHEKDAEKNAAKAQKEADEE